MTQPARTLKSRRTGAYIKTSSQIVRTLRGALVGVLKAQEHDDEVESIYGGQSENQGWRVAISDGVWRRLAQTPCDGAHCVERLSALLGEFIFGSFFPFFRFTCFSLVAFRAILV